ncbi:NAD-dependent epimerase/dehydratase family protein, partial [Chloroflexota bacterium]
MKNILVTGGAGFIGFQVSRHLAKEGHAVTICDNLSRGRLDNELQQFLDNHENCRFINCDLTDKSQMAKLGSGYDYVYHFAAIIGVIYTNEIPEKVLKTNTLITINLLDWFIENKCSKILFSSTSEVYAGSAKCYDLPIPTPENVPLTIEDVYNSRYSYAGSKILGELLFINYARAYDIDMSIVRYHNVYGPRMGFEHVIPELSMRIMKREDPFKLYGPEQTRAFCYIDDAVRATIKIMETPQAKLEIFNIGNDAEEIQIRHLASKLLEIADFSP